MQSYANFSISLNRNYKNIKMINQIKRNKENTRIKRKMEETVMKKLEETLVELDLKKYVKKEELLPEDEETGDEEGWIYYCENENWKWELRYNPDPDCSPGIFGAINIKNKSCIQNCVNYPHIPDRPNLPYNYFCDLFCQNTDYAYLDVFLKLIRSESFEDYYNKHLRFYEVVERELSRKLREYDCSLEMKVPVSLAQCHPVINCYFQNGQIVYRYEIYEGKRKLCICMPLSDGDDRDDEESSFQNVVSEEQPKNKSSKYKMYIIESLENMMNKAEGKDRKWLKDWVDKDYEITDVNVRNMVSWRCEYKKESINIDPNTEVFINELFSAIKNFVGEAHERNLRFREFL